MIRILFFLMLFGVPAFAGLKTSWLLDVRPIGAQACEQPVADWIFVAARLSSGSKVVLSPSMLFLKAKSATQETVFGHIALELKDADTNSATLVVSVWDRTGLNESSPYFKASFSSEHRLNVGEKQQIRFTQGDASRLGAALEYGLAVKLLTLEECVDQGSCLTVRHQ